MKLAAVPYLNALPLTRGLRHPISFYPPNELDRLLKEGSLDLATAPIATLFDNPHMYVVPGLAIGTDGPVKSVNLYINKNDITIHNIKYIYCDIESRTSVLLLKVLLAQRLHRDLNSICFQGEKNDQTEGQLLIGDKALEEPHPTLDLGHAWKEWTGLPFVFALWITPHETLPASLLWELQSCPKDSLANLEGWLEETRVFTPQFLKNYLTQNVCYELGPRQVQGIRLFHQKLCELGYYNTPFSLNFVETKKAQRVTAGMDLLYTKIKNKKRISREEATTLFHQGDLATLGHLADHINRQKNQNRVGYLLDRNINYTNVCGISCSFCAFARKKGDPETYVLTYEAIDKKIEETLALGGTGILLQGGHHPELPLEWYEDLLRHIKERHPIHLHAFSPSEIFHFSRLFRKSPEEILCHFKEAGLQSMPGGGGEILVDRVRKILSPGKVLTKDWLAISATAHRLGIPSSATMMMGHIETVEERFEHLEKIRQVQDETGGFVAFIPWTFQRENTRLLEDSRNDDVSAALHPLSSQEYLKMIALSRIFLDNFDHIQASWLTMGLKLGQTALFYGANDMGSIMMEENVVSAAGATHQSSEEEHKRIIREAGKTPYQRSNIFKPLVS